jgi:hypothetical protein
MAYVKAADVDPLDPIVASRIQRIIDNQEDHETRIASGATFVAVGTFVSPASTGNFSVTSVGFQPKLVEFTVVTTAGSTSNHTYSQGVMTTSGQWAFGNASRSSVPSTRSGVPQTNRCIVFNSINAGGTFITDLDASYVSMNSDGFTINFLVTSNVFTVLWKALA